MFCENNMSDLKKRKKENALKKTQNKLHIYPNQTKKNRLQMSVKNGLMCV